MVTARELREKTDRDLQALLSDCRTKLHELSVKAAAKQLKEVAAIRPLKRDIARLLTVLRERRTVASTRS